MSKRKPQQKKAPLSPENYIRQRSRNLTILECWVSSNWKKENLAHIIIVRQHASGNITLCAYLVDLACLGIKNTLYRYNLSQEDYDYYLKQVEANGITFEKISYDMAHNIIYAGLEYAEGMGFKPHRDFENITEYFLEEDNDDIPLIEIECGGMNGKPLYVNTGLESPAREKQILDQLKKSVGEGNYNFLLTVNHPGDDDYYNDVDDNDDNDFEDNDDDDFEEENDEYDEKLDEAMRDELDASIEYIKNLDTNELKRRYIKLLDPTTDKRADEILFQHLFLPTASNFLSKEYTVDAITEDYYSIISEDFSVETVATAELPNSLFQGIEGIDGDTLYDILEDTIHLIVSDKKALKKIDELEAKIGKVPLLDYLRLFYLRHYGKRSYNKTLEESYNKYPDYFLIKMLWLEYLYEEKKSENADEQLRQLLRNNNYTLTFFELKEYILCYSDICFKLFEEFNFEKLAALDKYVSQNLYPNEPPTFEILISSLNMTKIQKVAQYIKKEANIR